MIIRIPMRIVSELNSREHYMAKARRRKRERSTVGMVVAAELAVRGRVDLPCHVTLTRWAPSSGLDQDNLVSSFKATVDGIADALGIDDRDPRVTWSWRSCRARRARSPPTRRWWCATVTAASWHALTPCGPTCSRTRQRRRLEPKRVSGPVQREQSA